jgi:hypothetical protein
MEEGEGFHPRLLFVKKAKDVGQKVKGLFI